MMKKFMAALLLITAPMFFGLDAKDHHDSSGGCRDCRDGRDGRDGRDCDRNRHDDGAAIAYFYLRPEDVSNDDRTIDDGDAVIWDHEVFTIRSDSIRLDDDDHADIIIDKSGVYSIQYTIYGSINLDDSEGEGVDADYFTFELQVNEASVQGSRFTATVVRGTDNDDDAVELYGHVIANISANSVLELVNVSSFDPDVYSIDVYLDDEGGRQGISASIAIQKIADDVE
jgi:hypothetical protein